MSNQSNQPDLPFLRALKCAYKLHKAGLDSIYVRCYLAEAASAIEKGNPLPSAATPVQDLLPATFNFSESAMGEAFWQERQATLEQAQ